MMLIQKMFKKIEKGFGELRKCLVCPEAKSKAKGREDVNEFTQVEFERMIESAKKSVPKYFSYCDAYRDQIDSFPEIGYMADELMESELRHTTKDYVQSIIAEMMKREILTLNTSGKWEFHSSNLPEGYDRAYNGKVKVIQAIKNFCEKR